MPQKKWHIIIDENGDLITFAEELKEIAPEIYQEVKHTKKRVSHILPANKLKRMIFKTLRRIFGEEGKVADWTRKWKGEWIVVIDNEVKGKFKNRQEAIEFEKKYLFERF